MTGVCAEGVTFLALGNGAPDIFSAIAAFSNPHTAGLAVGALFGRHRVSHTHKDNKTTWSCLNMKTWLASSRSSLPPSTGAGIFVTTVVAGSVALVKPFTVASRPFLRDVTFYMVAVYWTFFMLYRGTTTMKETFGTHTQIHTHTHTHPHTHKA